MKTAGFTLLETIIYVALFSVLMSGSIITVYQLLESTEINQTALLVQAEALFVNQKLSWAFSGATEVTVISSSTLRITRPDSGLDNPLYFTVWNGAWYVSRDNTDGRDRLTSPEYPVSSVEFYVSPEVEPRVHILYVLEHIPFTYETILQL